MLATHSLTSPKISMNSKNLKSLRPVDRFNFLSEYISLSASHFQSLLNDTHELDEKTTKEELNQIAVGIFELDKTGFSGLDESKMMELIHKMSKDNLTRLKTAHELAPKHFDEFINNRYTEYSYVYALNSTAGISYLYLKNIIDELLECAKQALQSNVDFDKPDNRLKIIFHIISKIIQNLDANAFITAESAYRTGTRINNSFFHPFSTNNESKFVTELLFKTLYKGEKEIFNRFGVTTEMPDELCFYWPAGISDDTIFN
jgi:hypothetical protein